MSEAIDRYEAVAGGFDRVVKEVPAGGWEAETPCEGWTARDVVAHVVGNHRSMAAAVSGTEATSMGDRDDPVAAWSDAYETMLRLTRDPSAMAALVNGPGGQIPLEQALGSLASMDTHIHTWDLARAVGREQRLDPEMIRFTRAVLEPMGDAIRRPGVFGPEVEPPAGADEQDRLLCFLGRRP